jgi:inhibitor of KinA
VTLIPLGDEAWLVIGLGPGHAPVLAAALDGPDWEASPAYRTVGLYPRGDYPDARARLETLLAAWRPEAVRAGRRHHVPVCYELGEDLAEVGAMTGLTPKEVIARHAGATYRCAALGFCPGFPFLEGLPAELAGVPRRASPRLRVPAGSVAIAAGQAGVYPSETPGGWRLIGRTPLLMADLESGYFPIEPGDEVVFVPIDRGEFEARRGERLL